MVQETPSDISLAYAGVDTEPQNDVIHLSADGAELFDIHNHARSTITCLNSRLEDSPGEIPMIIPDDERTSLATRISFPILWAARKIGRVVNAIAIAFSMLGLYVLLPSLRDSTKPARPDNTGLSSSEKAWKVSNSYNLAKRLKKISHPTSVCIPLVSVTVILSFTLNGLNTIPVGRGSTYDGTREFRTTCPEGARRTQEGVLVKLFAATVTTVGINGHLGSLSGSISWRRELLRALGVVIIPLATVFHLAAAIFYELSFAAFSLRIWPDDVGVRYRLARMCRYRVPLASNQGRMHIGVINTRHLKMTYLTQDLKWYGRMFLLTVLLAQCVQTSMLLTRRFISHTTASVDLALMLMVISSVTALVQSFTISGVNAKWTLREDFQPCLEKSCRLPDCIDFKKSQGMPLDEVLDFKLPFGFRFIPVIPRNVLHTSTAGFLQLSIVLNRCSKPIMNVNEVISIYALWRGSVYFFTYCWVLHSMFFDEKESVYAHNKASNDADTSSGNFPTTSQPSPASTVEDTPQLTAENPTSTMLMYAVGITVGGLYATLGFLSILFHVFHAFAPFIITYLHVSVETSVWSSADPGKPCPELWKDGLEDMLWLF